MLKEWELVVDSSEQVRQRPKDYEEQKKCYSGKKKNHTRKNQLIVLPNTREIVDVIVQYGLLKVEQVINYTILRTVLGERRDRQFSKKSVESEPKKQKKRHSLG